MIYWVDPFWRDYCLKKLGPEDVSYLIIRYKVHISWPLKIRKRNVKKSAI